MASEIILCPQAQSGMLRIHVAGSTCTSWSRMGSKLQWAASGTLAFLVWAFDTRGAAPHVVIHECTSDFDITYLTIILGAAYTISSIVFSPKDLGFPSSRPRRYTMMVHRSLVHQCIPYSLEDFRSLFFRSCIATGHMFWDAPAEILTAFAAKLAKKRGLPSTQANGEAWPFRDVLSQSMLARLLAYERLVKKRKRHPHYIVNLLQNAMFMNCLSEITPTLLTQTSALWSMKKQRLLAPAEHLVVQGIPLFDARTDSDRFAVELMRKEGKLTDAQVVSLAGNGMSLIAVGAALLFALSTVEKKERPSSSSSPSTSPYRDDDEPVDNDAA